MGKRLWMIRPLLVAGLLTATLGMTGCSGDDGSAGAPGKDGADAPAARTVETCIVCHGPDKLVATADFMDVEPYTPNFAVEITDVALTTTTAVPGDGGLVVSFTVTDGMGGIPADADLAVATAGAKVNVSKLVAAVAPGKFTWQNYYNADKPADGVADSAPVLAGTTAIQADGGTCVLAEVGVGLGTFTCTETMDLTAVAAPLAVTWEPALTHRVAIYFGSHVAAPAFPGNGWVDLVPNDLATSFAAATAAVVDTRDIAETASCNECHGKLAGHGGDRVEVGICVTCHNPGTIDPDTGLSMDLAAMIHSIHLGNKGGVIAAVAGDNIIAAGTAHPVTGGENGAVLRATDYIVGHRGSDNNFSEIGFPNRLDNCTKCHTAADAATPDGDNHLNVISTQACVSCHDATSWNVFHAGFADTSCSGCHTGALSVAATHEFTVTAFVTTITMEADGDADGIYEEGDAPLITITVADGAAADVGNYDVAKATNTTYGDARLYIYGPRAKAAPVMATGSASDVFSNWNESDSDGLGDDNGICDQAEFDAGFCLPQQSHNLWSDETDPLTVTDAAGFKYQTMAVTADLTPGTYMIMARIGLADGTRVWALKNFNINTTTTDETLKVAGGGTRDLASATGGCESCHYLADYASTAHRAYFGTDGCLACHDQSGNRADPIVNRVHAVHSASALGDLILREWTEITYPQAVSHCQACHTSGNDSFETNPLGIACVGCHGDTPLAKDHMVQNGANFTEEFLTEEP